MRVGPVWFLGQRSGRALANVAIAYAPEAGPPAAFSSRARYSPWLFLGVYDRKIASRGASPTRMRPSTPEPQTCSQRLSRGSSEPSYASPSTPSQRQILYAE